jgi:hypothetical protein
MASIGKITAQPSQNMAFKAKKSNNQQNANTKVIIVRQTGGVAPAIISAVCPGLGQLLDGRPAAAAGAFFGVFGTLIGSLLAAGLTMDKFKNKAIGSAAMLVAGLVSIGAYLANIVNAAKGKKIQMNFDNN